MAQCFFRLHACGHACTWMHFTGCVALLHVFCLYVTQCRQQQARLLHPGQGHAGVVRHAMDVTTAILCCYALKHSMSEEERLGALRHVCSALPRTAQALPEQVRPLGTACADRHAVPAGVDCSACLAPCAWRSSSSCRRIRGAGDLA